MLRSAPAHSPAVGRKLSGADWWQLGSLGPVPRPPPPPGCLTSLTYFPFPFREHVQQSQEHGKVSVIALPHLIAIPSSLNASPRLPLWQHLLTSAAGSKSRLYGPIVFPGPELRSGEWWERGLHERVPGCWAGPSL